MIYIVTYCKFILPVSLVSELSPFCIFQLNSLSLIALCSLFAVRRRRGKVEQTDRDDPIISTYLPDDESRIIGIDYLMNDASLYIYIQPI